MQNIKEIKKRIQSVRDTQKVTKAMYLIASAKMQKAKRDLSETRPFFKMIQEEIKRVFRVDASLSSKYFYPVTGEHELPGAYAYLVVTADKGLAGAYNMNVIKKAISQMSENKENRLFVVGEYGRHYFQSHGIKISRSFLYTAQNPTLQRARDIADILLDGFNAGKFSKLFIIYTDFVNGMRSDVKVMRILPFHRKDFTTPAGEIAPHEPFEFSPSLEEVLGSIIHTYVAGYIYSALIDSFCAEQSARMTAMNGACDNAQKLLGELTMQYNHVRQSEITKEITEITAGAKR